MAPTPEGTRACSGRLATPRQWLGCGLDARQYEFNEWFLLPLREKVRMRGQTQDSSSSVSGPLSRLRWSPGNAKAVVRVGATFVGCEFIRQLSPKRLILQRGKQPIEFYPRRLHPRPHRLNLRQLVGKLLLKRKRRDKSAKFFYRWEINRFMG